MQATATSQPDGLALHRWFEHGPGCVLELTGTDSLDWLQGMLTADMRVGVGKLVRSLALDRLGKIKGELLVCCEPDRARLILIGGQRPQLVEHFQRYIIMEDVDVRVTDETAFSLRGAVDSTLLGIFAANGATWLGQCPWVTGADSVFLVSAEALDSVRNALLNQAISLGNASEWECLRVAAGLPAFGIDYDSNDTPGTAGLVDEMVSQTKGCYLGQEVVCKMLMRGAIRERLTRLRFEAMPAVGTEIRLPESETPVGHLSSVCAPNLGVVWAIGRLKSSAIESSAQVVAQGISGQICPRHLGR